MPSHLVSRFAHLAAQHRAQQEAAARREAATAKAARKKAIRKQQAKAVAADAERRRERKALRAASPRSVHCFQTSRKAATFVLAQLANTRPTNATSRPGSTPEDAAAFILDAAAKARPNRTGA